MEDNDWLGYVVIAIAVVSIVFAIVLVVDQGVASGPWLTVAENLSRLVGLLTVLGIAIFAVFTYRR